MRHLQNEADRANMLKDACESCRLRVFTVAKLVRLTGSGLDVLLIMIIYGRSIGPSHVLPANKSVSVHALSA